MDTSSPIDMNCQFFDEVDHWNNRFIPNINHENIEAGSFQSLDDNTSEQRSLDSSQYYCGTPGAESLSWEAAEALEWREVLNFYCGSDDLLLGDGVSMF